MGLLATLRQEQRATVINPVHPGDPALVRMFGSTENSTGITVTEDNAMSSTAFFAGVRFIAENMASVPLPIIRQEGRDKIPMRDDPRWWLLQHSANEEQTAFEFREMLWGFEMTLGNAYAEIVLDNKGMPSALWPIVSYRVRTARTPAGKLVYLVRRPQDGQEVPIPPERMLHLRGMSRDGVFGMDVIRTMEDALGITIAADRSAGGFFARGTQPSGVLETDAKLSEQAWERLKKQRDKMAGAENAHRLAILEEGVKWHQMSTDPDKSQLLETRKYQIAEVARILNLPLHILKELDRSTNNNIEHQGLELIAYTFRPKSVRLEQVLERRFLLPKERGSVQIRHNLTALIRGDTAARFQAYSVGRQWGWLSANDVLELEDRNGIGPQGDVYLAPVNMVPADKLEAIADKAAAPDEPPPDTEPDNEENARAMERRNAELERMAQAWTPVYTQRLQQIVRREVNAIKNVLKKAADVPELLALVRTFYNENGLFVAQEVRPMFDGLARQAFGILSLATGRSPNVDLDVWTLDYANAFGTRDAGEWSGILRQKIRGASSFGEARVAVTERLTAWDTSRAQEQAPKTITALAEAIAARVQQI